MESPAAAVKEVSKGKGMSPATKMVVTVVVSVFFTVIGANYVYDKWIPKPAAKA